MKKKGKEKKKREKNWPVAFPEADQQRCQLQATVLLSWQLRTITSCFKGWPLLVVI
jgi:hypothetical protein